MAATSFGLSPAYDHELLAVEALRLDPDPAVAGCIGAIDPLRYASLEAQLAGVRTKARAVANHVVAVTRAGHFAGQESALLFLPPDHRKGRKVLTVQEE
jgi:hypothetical protein